MYLILDRIVIKLESIINCRIEDTYIGVKEEKKLKYAFYITTKEGNFGYIFETLEEAIELRDNIFDTLPHTKVKVPFNPSQVLLYRNNATNKS